MAVLSIQSHVAFGHVGNRSAVFPLELLGFEVWPVNTVQFSNHTGYGSWTGEVFPARHIEEIWRGMKERGAAASCEAILSGYLGDPGVGQAILGAVCDVKAENPRALYCCDPVMGDYGPGFYVKPGILEFMRAKALPAADILTPNQFEAEALTETAIVSVEDAKAAARALHAMGPRIVLVTSFKPAEGEAGLVSFFLSAEGSSYLLDTPELPLNPVPNGAGDLTAALYLARYLAAGGATLPAVEALELMADSVYAVIEATKARGSRELCIVASRDEILAPRRRFRARAV
ncbi:MAG: pyridoxal kinase PdxY [Spirochaetaceae bacterium]|nr:pyridoxal kinase PdxY [Spirochaetaceae bacterium]